MRNRRTTRGIGRVLARVEVRAAMFSVVSLAAQVHAVAPLGGPGRVAGQEPGFKKAQPAALDYNCGYLSPERWRKDLQDAVARGEIPDPSTRRLPAVAPRMARPGAPACIPTPNTTDLFPFEDSTGLLLTNFSNGALFDLMTDAANALLAAEGDNFDFVAFWVNFTPDHTIGTAFYLGLENDVSGIGQGLFNQRAAIGLAGDNVEGYVMMWNINSSFWQPGNGGSAAFTRLVLGQEFEHRFGMFLPDLADGRRLQGDDAGCGRSAHWNFKVDGQGSGMEIAEWVGAAPATRLGGSLNFNTDIGGVWSYTDLYLMGYVSPGEMDAGNSELRYMNNSCATPYNGPISDFTSADIIATAGPRMPDAAVAQKDFRTGWIMIHQPGDPPSTAERTKAAEIMKQWTNDWNFSTLGRGTMNNTFRADCNPLIEWQPVDADVAHTIAGNEIVIPAGGARVTLDLFAAAWDPDLLALYQATVDSTGYTSGAAGSLSPVTVPDVSAGAFIDTARGDYVFASVPTLFVGVDTTTLDYTWESRVASADAVGDPGERRYGGTLILDVSPDAEGTFTIGFTAPTVLAGSAGDLTPLTMTPAAITIAPGNTQCVAAKEIACDSTVTFDNAAVSNPANPPYSCGIGSNHDGTLWFKFTATDPSARLSTCASLQQDSTFAVYRGGCGSLTEIGCGEDDDCGVNGFLTDQTVGGLIPGQTYWIQISAWSASDRGQYSLRLECSVVRPNPPQGDPTVPDAGHGTKNRYLSFSAGEPGRSQAVRVTFTDMPPAFQSLVGTSMWVGPPQETSENSGKVLPADAPPGTATFEAATLQCDPFATDWEAVGLVHVYDQSIVPGATFNVQVVDAAATGVEEAFSDPLTLTTSLWGDIVENCSSPICGPPDGTVDVPTDVVAVIDKFSNNPGAPTKARTDLGPALTNRIIDITDVNLALDAFRGRPFPFAPPTPCPLMGRFQTAQDGAP